MIICLNGAPRTGKTTAAKVIVGKKQKFRLVSLNKPFVDFVKTSLNYSDEYMLEMKDSLINPMRRVYIDVADSLEKVDPDVWIKKALQGRGPYSLTCVIDSIGKYTQWEYVKNWCASYGHDLIMVSVEDGDGSKVIRTQQTYVDQRHDVIAKDKMLGKFEMGYSHVPLVNVPEHHRSGDSLKEYRSKIKDVVKVINQLAKLKNDKKVI